MQNRHQFLYTKYATHPIIFTSSLITSTVPVPFLALNCPNQITNIHTRHCDYTDVHVGHVML